MKQHSRRQFLADVGTGMLVSSVGAGLAFDLGLSRALAEEAPALNFGDLEPLVCLMQDTAPGKLLPLLVERQRTGTDLKTIVAAAALANARTFGGEDYVGFHTMMALAPAYHMSRELPDDRQALPILKVLYRNSNRIRERGGRKNEVLHPVKPGPLPEGKEGGLALLERVRQKDMAAADSTFATLAQSSPEDALNYLIYAVEDKQEVHRIVLPYRAWDLLPIIGKEHALTMLRQSVHYCVRSEKENWGGNSGARALLPKLMDQYHLPGKGLGAKKAEDGWVAKMSETIFKGTPAQAAEAVAAALAEGMATDAIGEAIALAANQLVLRDHGRPQNQTSAGKPVGSVHGDSIGVHACDSANAWRNLARAGNPRNTVACLILGAFQVARDRVERGGDFLNWQPYPHAEVLEKIKATGPADLLREAEAAIKDKDQPRAAAAVHRYGEQGHPARPVFDLLLRYAISEDGALHAEKYYRTTSEEFAASRPAFRWRQVVALARVTASAYGQAAPGHAEACKLLKV